MCEFCLSAGLIPVCLLICELSAQTDKVDEGDVNWWYVPGHTSAHQCIQLDGLKHHKHGESSEKIRKYKQNSWLLAQILKPQKVLQCD